MTTLPELALSVRQPWAWAILNGKDIENRSAASVRHGMKAGTIALHAAKGMTQDEYEHARSFMASIGITCPRPDALVRGAVIGVMTVTDIVSDHKSPWFFGPRGLVLANQTAIDPIPSTGALGYFKWQNNTKPSEPKPWMKAWPKNPARKKAETPTAPAAMPLFEEDKS